MMTLLSTANYIPAFLIGLFMIFLTVKFLLIPIADLTKFVQSKTCELAIIPMTFFVFIPALGVFGIAVVFTFSMFTYMIGLSQ